MKHILTVVVMAFAICLASGQDRFFAKKDPYRFKTFIPNKTHPGELVTADKDGILTMDNRTANIKGSIKSCAPNEAMNALSSWAGDSDWVEWNIDIPFDGDYFVDLSWTAGRTAGQGTLHPACGDQKIDWVRPNGLDWDHEIVSRIGKMSLKKGNTVFTLKRTTQKDGQKGIANIVFVKLVPYTEDYANKFKKVVAKSAMDLTSRERNIIWGSCAYDRSLQLYESRVEYRSKELTRDPLSGAFFRNSYRNVTPLSAFERFAVGDYFYRATVYKQRCIALDISKKKMTSKEALELVKVILPKAKFKISRNDLNTSRFTLTSLDRDQSYDLEYWQKDDLCHLCIHNQKLVMDMFPEKTTDLKTNIDAMYKTIAQNALKAGKKDLFKSNWMDLNEKQWTILAGGPSDGNSTIAKRKGGAQEWTFGVLSLKAQFDENGKITCFSINSPFAILPRDMVALASKLFPALFFESPSSTLKADDEFTLKAKGPQGRQYECACSRYNYNTEFSITPVSALSPGKAESNEIPEPPKKSPTDYSKLGL